jgi:hypothetical protein
MLMTEYNRLVDNVRVARLALAQFMLDQADAEHTVALQLCKCNPDAHEYDPACLVADTMNRVQRAQAEVDRWSPTDPPA